MTVQRKLKPGNPGTKKYLNKYGEKLVSVRYILDKDKKEKITTVELVENRKVIKQKEKPPHNKIVFLKINFDEYELRSRVKNFGGIWDVEKKLWKIDYHTAKVLELTDRIVRI